MIFDLFDMITSIKGVAGKGDFQRSTGNEFFSENLRSSIRLCCF